MIADRLDEDEKQKVDPKQYLWSAEISATSTFFESKGVSKIEQTFNRRKSAFGSVRRIVEANLVAENSAAKILKHVSES